MTFRQIVAYAFYPLALGTCFLKLIDALGERVREGTEQPPAWVIAFGVWFLLYEGIWYAFLLRRKRQDEPPATYSRLSAVTDVVDAICLFAGFTVLGLVSGHYEVVRASMVYSIVLVLVLSAAVANVQRWRKTFGRYKDIFGRPLFTFPIGFLMSAAIPVWGIIQHRNSLAVADGDNFLLFLLYVMLFSYVVVPSFFSSQRW